jgi:hypothetical protein
MKRDARARHASRHRRTGEQQRKRVLVRQEGFRAALEQQNAHLARE